MKNGIKGALLVWALLMQAGAQAGTASESVPAAAKPDAPSGAQVGALPLRLTLESKLRLVSLLLTQSPAVQRISQSNKASAKQELAAARVLYTKAEAESVAGLGSAEAAIQLLDESLRLIVSASRLVPDAAQQAAQERSRNTDLGEAIRSFQTLHKNISSRLSTRKVQTSAGAAEIGRIDAMMEQANAFTAGGNQHEANLVLNSAYRIMVLTLNKMLAAETISYHLKFDTPVEEFQHELARNRSYEELIPMALAQLNPTRETATLAERYVQQSRDLRDAAQKQAGRGDHHAAVMTLQDATSRLQRSLRIAGVVVPQTPETQP